MCNNFLIILKLITQLKLLIVLNILIFFLYESLNSFYNIKTYYPINFFNSVKHFLFFIYESLIIFFFFVYRKSIDLKKKTIFNYLLLYKSIFLKTLKLKLTMLALYWHTKKNTMLALLRGAIALLREDSKVLARLLSLLSLFYLSLVSLSFLILPNFSFEIRSKSQALI